MRSARTASTCESRNRGILDKAREFLAKARDMLASWPDEAGRAAHLAGFHAAQGLIFEGTGQMSKTHSGVQAQFSSLARNESRLDLGLRSFLGRAFRFKTSADYETGSERMITQAQASTTIDNAVRFVETIASIIESDGS